MDTSTTSQQPQRPLQGLRILDFSRVLTGPHATRMLCDLGAEVIKIEPPDGDLTRFTNPRVNSLSTYFIQQNVGKKNISLDISKPEAVDIVKKLVMHADILIENFRPGVMKKLGLDYASLSALNPKLIYASITGYGQTGPWVHRRAYAPVVGAESGLTNHQGMARGGQFANDPFSHADVYTAMETCAAVLAAVIQRHTTGRGQSIDIAMAQTMLYVNEHAHDALWDEPTPPEQIRSFEPGNYPVLTAANGDKVVVSGHPGERGTFDLFFTAIGRTDLLTNPKFIDVPSRLVNLEELQSILRAWALTIPDATAIEEALAKHKLASGKIRTTREFADTDWAAAREITVEVSNRGGGKVRIPNAPWKFSDATVTTAGSPKYRGEDNALVLGNLLGLSATEVDALTEAGVLQRRVPSGATP
ncbi:MAG: CoA transferase [Ilumatobacteraceae bacterium]|nr:CoA transferase [Ilumatobacteraceae bacterium]